MFDFIGKKKGKTEAFEDAVKHALQRLEDGSLLDCVYELTELAHQGSPEAEYWLGDISEFIRKDDVTAAKWYESAAKHGHQKSKWCIANLYFVGKGVKKNIKKARHWYLEAAEAGVAEAMFTLGELYRGGEFAEKDDKKAKEFYLRAADAGHEPGRVRHRQFYGELPASGAEGDLNKELFVRIPDPSPEADEMLEAARRVNPAERYKICERAAALGHPFAMYLLGCAHSIGEGAPKDRDKAHAWFLKSAQGGCGPAQYQLAYYYDQKYQRGSPERQKMLYWCQKAAETGLPEAENMLGNLYFFGDTVPLDKREGLRLISSAAQKGDENAAETLKALSRN